MARWYSENPDYSEISEEEKILRDKIVEILSGFTQEMENYSYFGSNPGIEEDDYEDVADEILKKFSIVVK